MTDIPSINEIYRHFKGNLYRIVALAVHSETGGRMVVYQALYGDYTVYVRELSDFMSKVDRTKYPDTEQEDRFELVPQILGQGTAAAPAAPPQPEAERERVQETPPEAERERREEEKPDAAADRDTRTEAQPEIKPDAVRTQETMPEAEREQESAQPELDPFLLQFLDADSYGEKLNLLAALHVRITDDMIDTMAASLDVEVNEGELEERYAALKGCLLTLEKYECHRLR